MYYIFYGDRQTGCLTMDGYNGHKAAQVAAYFALRAGGTINILKLAKLLYLAERESMNRFDEPMFFDRLVSMDHGPVTSISLNNLNGLGQSDDWSRYVSGRAGYEVGVADQLTLEGLDELSRADIRILEDLWDQFGAMGKYELRDWTHRNCPEWEDPHGSSQPIRHDRVFKFLGKPDPSALAEAIYGYRNLARVMNSTC
jgi:uncharacterized phage-associated protein